MSVIADSHNRDNRQIARNTLFLYIRMLAIMGVTLYTTRVVMEALGIDDYGIYNVVGGLSASFIFFSSALTNATQRFLNFELGKGNNETLGRIFNLSWGIYAAIAIAVLMIGGAVGTWYIKCYMTLPPDRIHAAIVTLWAMLLSLVATFIGAVYESVLIARENMKIYAYIGLFDAGAKLAVAFIILYSPDQRLILYSILLALAQIISKAILIAYCRKHYSETAFRPYWNADLFRRMFAFAGWNILGSGVWSLNEQGVTLLVNHFFGLAVNAARGITWQVTAAINNFAINFFTAIRPQIIKSYACGEISRYTDLVYSGTRYSAFLTWAICLPIILRTQSILSIWLVDVPTSTSLFVQWALVYTLVNTLTNPLWSGVQAVGRLRATILYGSTFFMLAFPLSWLLIIYGFPAVVTYQVLTIVRIGYIIISFHILKQYVTDFTWKSYVIRAIWPSMAVCGLSFIVMYPVSLWIPDNFIGLVAVTMISVTLTAAIIFVVGLNHGERSLITEKIVRRHQR